MVIGLITISFLIFFIVRIPVKNAVKLNLTQCPSEALNSKDTRIFCDCQACDCTGPYWLVIGKGNGLYSKNHSDKYASEYIELDGNYPKKLNYDLFGFGKTPNVFILEGSYEGEKKDDSDIGKHKVFKVTKWDILYPIKRNNDFTLSPNWALTIGDDLNADDVPNYE